MEAYTELRAVIDGLLPPDLTAHDLAESVRRYAEVAGRAHGRRVRFHASDLPRLGAEVDEVVYRVAQEALHNALRHSSAAGAGPVAPAMAAGAAGYLYKDVDPEALVRAIRTAADGNLVLAPAAAGPLTTPPAPHQETRGAGALTGRERQVLALLAQGRSNREIARAFGVSEKTVKTHVSSVLAKLGVQDRTQAALHAVRHGLAGT